MDHNYLLDNNGAVQTDAAAPDKPPVMVVLAGPIKIWWKEWGSVRHREYAEWRDKVRLALVKAGYLVYSPHRAIQGSWHPKAQLINNSAILMADCLVVLTPFGLTAEETEKEIALAKSNDTFVVYSQPGDDHNINMLLGMLKRVKPRL